MSNNAALATWAGLRSAKQLAADRWDIAQLPEAEEARHERMMRFLRRLESPMPDDHHTVRFSRDRTFWRREAWCEGLEIDLPCDCVEGTRMVADGNGGVEWDTCIRCDFMHREPRTTCLFDDLSPF